MRYTERTYRLIEKWGWYDWWIVERHNAFSGKKTDLFHIIDCVVLTHKGIVGIQTCGADFAEHVNKMMDLDSSYTRKWLHTPKTRLFLIGWRRLGKRTKGKKDRRTFYPRIAQITLEKGELKIKEHQTNKERTWTAGRF